jgi:hypothetical protein
LQRRPTTTGIIYYGLNLEQIRSGRERFLREQTDKEDTEFESAMTYACQMMQKRIYSTMVKETTIVEEEVATAEGSMTNRIMFTEVMVTGEKMMNTKPQQPSQNSNVQKTEGQDITGNNMEFHKPRDEITRLTINDNTGVLESEQKTQDIRKEDLKRGRVQKHGEQ